MGQTEQESALSVLEAGPLDTGQCGTVPAGYVAMNLAQAAYNAAKEAYQRPEIRADYERRKAERNARAKQEEKD